MEGKETRFGIANSALWAAATTAASNGSVNSMHDSFTPLGGLVPLWLMQLGEVVFGGVGCGLYGMLVFAIVAVFVAGLMVGRTPEYLGKKIEALRDEDGLARDPDHAAHRAELGTALGGRASMPAKSSVLNPGAHGFCEMLYAFSSAGNNNGSAFGGLECQHPLLQYDGWSGDAAKPLLDHHSDAGDRRIISSQESRPRRAWTLPTHTPLIRRDAYRHRRACRRADLRPGTGARSTRRTLDHDRLVTLSL